MADHSKDFDGKYVGIVAGIIGGAILLAGLFGIYLGLFG